MYDYITQVRGGRQAGAHAAAHALTATRLCQELPAYLAEHLPALDMANKSISGHSMGYVRGPARDLAPLPRRLNCILPMHSAVASVH